MMSDEMKDMMKPEKVPNDFTDNLMARINREEEALEQAMFTVMRNHLIEEPSPSFANKIMATIPVQRIAQKPVTLRWLVYISLIIIGVIIGITQILNGAEVESNGFSNAASGMLSGIQQIMADYPMAWTMVIGLTAIILLDGGLRWRNASKV